MTIFDQISSRIIKEQELIIGPVAWEQAKKVPGLRVIDASKGEVALDGNVKDSIQNLVSQYSNLFGPASAEACREAGQDLLV